MTIASEHFAGPAGTSVAPESEQLWRGWAEKYIAELEQAVAAAQTQLRQQEARFQALLDVVPGPAVVVAASGEVVMANEHGSALLAPAPKQVPEPLSRLMEATAHPASYPVTLADNQYEAVIQPAGSETVLYLHDTTALRSAEAALVAQQEQYETILHELPVEIAVFDAAHRYTFVNAASIKNPELRTWLIGQDDFAYCAHRQRPQELAVRRRARFDHVVQTRTAAMWEEQEPMGEQMMHIQRHYRPVFAPDGALRMVVGMAINVTERRQMEERLVEQRTFYEFVLDHLPTDVGVFDNQFRYRFVNARGIKDSETRKWVIGKDNFAYFQRTGRPESMARERQAQLEEAARTGELVTYEETFTRPDGDRHLLRCLQPVFHPDGSLHLILGYGLDVTERVATERALRHAKITAESAVRARELFLANMSHEIRTPMNAILGMSQLLAKTPLTPIQSSYQEAITTSAENLLVIINDILDLSKLEAGKMALEQVGFAPTLLLDQVEQTLRYKAAEKGLRLRTELDERLPAVLLGDPYRITQVLLNLAGNAIKFTERGEVVVACEVVTASSAAAGPVIQFRVTDTGVGIEPEFLARIFQEFSQEDASVTRKFGGTGLGLSICRNLVKLMGGDVQVRSQKNQGTVVEFTLSLPVGSASDLLPQTILPEDSAIRQNLRYKHVLLVEDNRFNRQIARTFLQQAQVQVTEAENGEQAVELAQAQPFDLILMDIQMPVLDGYAATAALRHELQVTTPIIALTANAIKGEREKCLAAGMNGYLAKPFQETALLQVVSEWMAPHHAAPIPVPAPPLFRVDELLKIGQGDQEFVRFMLETFLESSEEILLELTQGLQEGNLTRLKTAAHTLKPGLTHLCVEHLIPPVAELDQWQADFQRDALTALILAIAPPLREVMDQMRAYLTMPE
ncbi:response regulator [Hymenobacter aerilatus]|uniref:Sensory/regulatory protein RpfC n=1 Tax=Hymenobacter aerilatus TaxID=2932251 RepID=A0A8T9SU62_9BACT|nr:response regulator [Hymenobacter aerilatus]UOR05297.1 response regulator [Hymenobacter aerilatus]